MALHCELHLECMDPAVNSIALLHIKGKPEKGAGCTKQCCRAFMRS